MPKPEPQTTADEWLAVHKAELQRCNAAICGGFEQHPLSAVFPSMPRRHLTTSDRSLIAARLAPLKHGEHKKGHLAPLKIGQAAASLAVSPNSVKRARKLLDRGTPELIAPRWIDDIRRDARAAGCSLYEKSNLLLKEPLGGGAVRYQFTDEPPAAFDHYLGKKL